jgi:hypothetical protein
VAATPSNQLWGYFPIAIALGLFAYVLLWVERSLEEPRYAWRAAVAALVIAWLHPWQGLTVIIVLLVVALFGRPLSSYWPLVAPLVAAGLPLIYFDLLPHVDHAWKVARDQNSLGGAGWGMVLGTVGPLALLGLGRPRLAGLSIQARVLVIWPLAALFVYWLAPPYQIHALETMTLPLAVLALRGWHFLPARRLVLAGCVALLAVPGLVYLVDRFHQSAVSFRTAYVLSRGDTRAFHFIASDSAPGGVLARVPQSLAVPGLTGRRTWVGHPSWTPAFDLREGEANQLFAGQLTPEVARHRVLRIGAPIVFAACGSSPRLADDLRPIVAAERRFGCATVYFIRR